MALRFKDTTSDLLDKTAEALSEGIEKGSRKAGRVGHAGIDRAADAVSDGLERGRKRARKLGHESIDRAVAVVSDGADRGTDAARKLGHKGIDRAVNKMPRRKHRRGRLLVIGSLILSAAGVALLLLKRRRRHDQDKHAWQDSPEYVPGGFSTHSYATNGATVASSAPFAPVRESEMINRDFAKLIGQSVKDVNGHVLGEVQAIYAHSGASEPEWIALALGATDDQRVLAPLEGAKIEDEVELAYPKNEIEEAPALVEEKLSLDDELRLYAHYNVRRMPPPAPAGAPDDEVLHKWTVAA